MYYALKIASYLVWLLFYFHTNASAEDCTFYRDEVYGGTVMNCNNVRLREIPKEMPENITTLLLMKNCLTTVRNYTFLGNSRLCMVDFQRNQIDHLEPKAFAGLNCLQKLYLSHNRIRYHALPDGVFRPLKSLIVLDLQNNILETESYPDSILSSLFRLEELRLDTYPHIIMGHGFTFLLSLDKLIFGNYDKCLLKTLYNDTFENLANSSLTYLDFSSCPLQMIEAATFLPLENINYISFYNSAQLTVRHAMHAMYGLQGKTLSFIDMHGIFNPGTRSYKDYGTDSQLSSEVSKYLVNVCVKKLCLSHNKIFYANVDALKHGLFAKCIEHLDLSHNMLLGDILGLQTMSPFINLRILDISDQRINSHGPILSLVDGNVFFINLPQYLERLNMSRVVANMESFPEIHVMNGTSMLYLGISSLGVRGFKGRLRGLENLKVLQMSDNEAMPFRVDYLNDFPNLTDLQMDNMNFNEVFFYNNCNLMFSKLKFLEFISLRKNKFTVLPLDIFVGLQYLKHVDLSRNNLLSVTTLMLTIPSLRTLEFSHNSLTMIPSGDIAVLNSAMDNPPFALSLVGNPIICSCESLDFVSWLFEDKVILDQSGNYLCTDGHGTVMNTRSQYLKIDETRLACISGVLLTVSIIFICLTIIICLCVFLVVNNWTMIQHILIRRFASDYIKYTRTDFTFCLYIGYNDIDYEFVYTTIYEILERDGGLKLCLQERDLAAGVFLSGAIVQGVNSSWKTLVVITRDYMSDPTYFTTIQACIYAVSVATPRRVILLIMSDVNLGDISEDILNVVHEDDIFIIPGKEQSERALTRILSLVKNDGH